MALAEGRWTKVEGRVRGRFTMAKDLFVLVNCMHTYAVTIFHNSI